MKNKQIEGSIEFKETQQFRQPWFWLLMVSPVLAAVGVTIYAANKEGKFGQVEMIALIGVIFMNLVMLYGFFVARFEIVVTESALYYRWSPFIKKYSVISPSNIDKVYERKSPFLQIGYKRRRWGYGTTHNLGSRSGLQFVLKSGRKVFIGAEKIKGFERAVEKLIPVSTK